MAFQWTRTRPLKGRLSARAVGEIPEGLDDGGDSTELAEVLARSAWNNGKSEVRPVGNGLIRCDTQGLDVKENLQQRQSRSLSVRHVDVVAARSYRSLRDGTTLAILPRHFMPGLRRAQSSRYHHAVPTGRRGAA